MTDSRSCLQILLDFIRKLPHNLVEAFKSTLEEAKYADYIIHVVDCSNPQAVQQMEVVYDTLQELGVQGKKTITYLTRSMWVQQSACATVWQTILLSSAKQGKVVEDLKAASGGKAEGGPQKRSRFYYWRTRGQRTGGLEQRQCFRDRSEAFLGA